MDEIKKLLREVLKEELQPLKDQLTRMETKLNATFEHVAKISERQTSTNNDLVTHEHSIDILNREQLRMKAEIEMLKNK